MSDNRLLADDIKKMLNTYYDVFAQDSNMDGRVLEELPFLSSHRQADFVFVNEVATYGIEIKSDGDSLKTLEEQVNDYQKVFDFVSVCTTKKFLEKVRDMYPHYGNVGVFLADDGFITEVSPAKYNHWAQLRQSNCGLTGFLNSSECGKLIKSKGIKGYSRWDVDVKRAWLCQFFTMHEIRSAVRHKLMTYARDGSGIVSY